MRTPLTRLQLKIESIEDAGLRARIVADLAEMGHMIDATLSFLRDDMAKEEVAPVDIAAILETIVSDAEDAGHAVVLASPRTLVVPGRHLALKRALSNLIENAVKYGRSASIAATKESRSLRIRICDRGAGIAPEKLERVFEPFYRVEEARNKAGGGYGLGLSVARSILRAHGGDVRLSNAAGGGLEATVTLPLGKAA